MSWVAAAVVGSSLVSGYMGSKAAKEGAQIQADAAKYSADQQRQMFDVQNQQYAPYRSAGYSALNRINSMLGGQYVKYDYEGNPIGTSSAPTTPSYASDGSLVGNMVSTAMNVVGEKPKITPTMQNAESDYLTRQFTPQDFQAGIDPGYAFRLQQGQEATNRQANLGGGALGGNTLKAIQDYSQGLASQEYGNAFNRFQVGRQNIYNTLAGIAGIGQNAQNSTAQLAANTAGNIGQLAVGAAGAQAAGTVGAANAWGNAAQGGTSGLMLNQLLRPQTAGVNTGVNYQGYGGANSVGNFSAPSYELA